MQWFPCLKTGLKRINLSVFLLFLACSFCFAEAGVGCGLFRKGEDGNLFLCMDPVLHRPDRIRACLADGRRCELYVNFRFRQSSDRDGFSGRELREFRISRCAFLDPVSGDYIIQKNGRDTESHGTWAAFFKAFSSPFGLSIAVPFEEGMTVWAKERLVYKKLFAPFSILYLVPGKYIYQSPWFELEAGGPF